MHTSLLARQHGAGLAPVSFPPQGPPHAPPPRLIEVLWRRRWTLVLTCALCAAAAGIYLYAATPIFLATGRLTVTQNAPRVYSDAYGFAPSSDSYLQTEAEVLRSAPVLRRALALAGPGLRTFADVRGDPVAWLRRGTSFKVEVARRSG